MSLKFDGFDEIEDQLNSLSKKAAALDGRQSIPLSKLFTETFMISHSSFSSLDQLLESSNIKIKNQEDFDNFPEEQLDLVIKEKTDFLSWKEMMTSAGKNYVVTQLGL